MVLIVVLEGVTTLFRGLGLFQSLIEFLYGSGLRGPLLRSMFIKEIQGLKFQFLLGDAKNHLGSNVSYYQAREQSFWADLKAWEQTPKASPSPILGFYAKFDVFSTKIAKFFDVSVI